MMEWLKLQPNVPVDLVLAYDEGRLCNSGYVFGGVGGRGLFLGLAAGAEVQARMRQLGVRRGDRVRIVAFVSYQGGRRRVDHRVFRPSSSCGSQPDGTFVVPCIGGAL